MYSACFLVFLGVISALPQNHHKTSTKLDSTRSSSEFTLDLEINSTDKFFLKLTLSRELQGSDIFTNDFQLIVIENDTLNDWHDFRFLDGYAIFNTLMNHATGYLKNGSFYGTFILGEEVYYVDEFNDGELAENAVVYARNSLMSFQEPKTRWKRDLSFKERIGDGKYCSLSVMIEPMFLCGPHKGDITQAVHSVKDAIEMANWRFRSTDFNEDGIPTNVGLKIKNIIVLQSTKSKFNMLPKYQRNMDGELFLRHVAQYPFVNQACLGVMFTTNNLFGKTLGMSFVGRPNRKTFNLLTGGICEKSVVIVNRNLTLNVLFVTHSKDRDRFYLVVTHELGHSFGATHDNDYDCLGHIMEARTRPGIQFTFSPCSKRDIYQTIKSHGTCLQKDEEAYCGNGIAEPGEDCDCGHGEHCRRDPCCYSRRANPKQRCRAKSECHPQQGLCCSKNCKINDLKQIGFQCAGLLHKCPCRKGNCACGIESTCLGNVCHSQECVRINLEECPCPKTGGDCFICCMYQGKCQEAQKATSKVLQNDSETFREIKTPHFNVQVLKRTRKEFWLPNNKSIEFEFLTAKNGEFCVANGKLGQCRKGGCHWGEKYAKLSRATSIFSGKICIIIIIVSRFL